MKATITILGLLALALAAQLADPVGLAAASVDTIRTAEPAWMVLSGASLLAVASLVRRYVP